MLSQRLGKILLRKVAVINQGGADSIVRFGTIDKVILK